MGEGRKGVGRRGGKEGGGLGESTNVIKIIFRGSNFNLGWKSSAGNRVYEIPVY